MKSEGNKKLAGLLSELAAFYRYKGIKERFRAGAYEKAAKVIAALPEDIDAYIKNDTLKNLTGIGESIAEKIVEFSRTGKIKKYERLKESVPYGLIGMMEIKGFGPQSLKQIHTRLKVSTKEELIRALQDGRVAKLKHFGKKKVENMLWSLGMHKIIEERLLLSDALEAGETALNWLKQLPEVTQAEFAGSLRRKKETIGDIDILAASDRKDRGKIIAHFTSPQIAKQVLARGDTRAGIILKSNSRQVDLRIVNPDEWGAALQYFTGSKEHNIHLRTLAKERGFKISEYGIFSVKTGKKIAGKTEEEIYRMLGFRIMPPEMREDKGEIELAAYGKIPELVSLSDIKGDLQMHSLDSDGVSSLEEIAGYVAKKLPYEYFAITDHSQSSRIAGGLAEKEILRQVKEVKRINEKLGRKLVKSGIEVDILPDGSLDISDEVLSQLDWVTASIHSNFNRDNTERIVRACENPYVHCIGHPTGRLIGSREAYKVDMKEVIRAARRTGTALEINAQPERLDLNDDLARLARENGVKLVISTDSHSLQQLDFMKLGVFVARRAWCTASDILNTMKWPEIEKWKERKLRHAEHLV